VTATGSFGVFTWTGQNTPTTADLYGSSFISENLGFAVGYKNFLFFRDGAWSRTEVTTMDMRALSILSATKGYAAGGTVAVPSNGLVYTYDGTSWTLLAGTGGTIAGAFLNGVSFVDTNTGWIVGDNSLIRKTTTGGTGGTPWSAQTAPVAGLSLKAVQFLDANNGWIVGSSGAIFNSTNGTDWATRTSGTGNTLFALHMLSATDGWAVGANGTVLHYSSGTWSASTVGGAAYHAVYFLDANQGLIGGTDGVVYTTANGGATWTQEDSGISSTITDCSFITRSQGWAVGGGGNVRYYHQVY